MLVNDIPPLEELAFAIADDYTWCTVLRGCKDSLLSLRLALNYYETDSLELDYVFLLPLCKTLAIHCDDDVPSTWELSLATPVLEYYTEYQYEEYDFEDGHQVLHTDTRRVVRIRTNRPPPPDAAVPNLNTLEVDNLDIDLSLIDYLAISFSNGNVYPTLERITYCSKGADPVLNNFLDSKDFIEGLNSERTRPIIFNVVNTWEGDMPGTIKSSCGVGMSCHDY
ncbi:hypothetical protein M408DRAFT_30332 [Serendipita vermifera MAFF 305830]|uniref:F-box domain-containing protein n=1 Tax=Serendipita vermifera MAFF 305830 TaxID=933852 RepID=A0A0C3AMF3_SERVB|nr:hypothetical protein M408DRAFT_30332 [Serendipita vermifera MAFF 305830]